MNPIIEAALIANGTTVGLAGIAGGAALWRLGRNRRHARRTTRVEEFQDRSGELREANRDYGRDLRARADQAADEQAGNELILPAGTVRHVDLGPSVARETDAAQATAEDRARIAAVRVNVDDPVLVELNERWRRLSWLHSVENAEVTAGEEDAAWMAFSQACAQALNARSGKLTRSQRTKWRTHLLKAQADDADSTDPDPT